MCRERVLDVMHKNDKYVFNVACTACDERHRFTLKRRTFWKKPLTVLSCPQTLVDIMFIGEEKSIDEELKKQNALYMEATEEMCRSTELGLYFEIIQIVNELAKTDNIHCGMCDGKQFDIVLEDAGVKITCVECGSEAIVEINVKSLEELLETGTIVLE